MVTLSWMVQMSLNSINDVQATKSSKSLLLTQRRHTHLGGSSCPEKPSLCAMPDDFPLKLAEEP